MNVITENPIRYSNMDDDTKKALIGTGVATAGALALALAQKGRKTPTDIQQKCGKRPLLQGKRKQYDDCVASANSQATQTQSQPIAFEQPKGGLSKNAKIGIGIGVAVALGLVVYLVIKHKK